jgi:iron complex transport system substrate-binding protein
MSARVRASIVIVAAMVAAALALDARAQPGITAVDTAISVRDDRGRVVSLARAPLRVVSLLPSLTETVCELGACERLVGVDRHSNWPASLDALPRLGGMEDLQVERVVTLKPDLVLASRSTRAVERLESLGLTVLSLEVNTLAETRQMIATVATALGRPADGEQLWRRIEQRIDAAAARVPASLRGQRVYFEVSSAPHAAGEASFIGELITRLGIRNIAPAALGPFPQLNPEFIVRAKPSLVMASERSLAGMAKRPGWSGLAALREGRVCGFRRDAYDLLVRPGPRLAAGAEAIADCLAALPTSR